MGEGSARPRASAVIVRVELPPALERLRLACVRVGLLGMPAHVTLLYPFIPPARLRPSDVSLLRRLIRDEPAFELELARAATFAAEPPSPGTTYLAPEPAEPFARLTRAIWAAFPGHAPFEGVYEEIVPHVTIADDASRLEEVARTAAAELPIRQRVGEAWLIVEGDDDRWTRRATFRLGPRRGPRACPGA